LEAFDPYIDSDKIRDGDVYVYAGKEAEKRADSFKDMFEIETLSVKELRRKAQQLLK
jgi:ABC-type Zn uptake system ZnuABC Zn-binding protein ZnuA